MSTTNKRPYFFFSFFLASLIFLFFGPIAQSQEKKRAGKRGQKKVVQYKKYQSFDLGGLQIDGKVLAPGDLTINNQERRGTDYPLFNRRHFRPEIVQDIHDTR